ncbi:MAG: hypothetical protein RLY70_1274, partial [Planctomycetota bacterium]
DKQGCASERANEPAWKSLDDRSLAASWPQNSVGATTKSTKSTKMEFDELSNHAMDLLIEIRLIVEWTSVAKIRGIHAAQRLTCMKWAVVKIGRLMNFNATKLKDGIQRFLV